MLEFLAKLAVLICGGVYLIFTGTPWLITGWGPVRLPSPKSHGGLGPGHHDVGPQARFEGAFFVVLGLCCLYLAYRAYREYRDPPD